MPAQHAALQNTGIVEKIVEHIAPGKACASAKQAQCILALTLISRAFHDAASTILWAELPSLLPLLLILPEFRQLYQAHREEHPYGSPFTGVHLSKPVGSDIWARFCNRAALVRTLHSKDDTYSDGVLADESWSYLARLHAGVVPLFSSLRTLTNWKPSSTGEDLRLLASTSLVSVTISHAWLTDSQGDDFVDAIEQMLTNAPGLTHFGVISTSGDLFARISPGALLQLRSLRFEVDQASDMAPEEWYPDIDALQVLSTLPLLEYLRVELSMDRRDRYFVGFEALNTLHIIDCGSGDATWFLERCLSPLLHKLTLDLTNLCWDFEWDNMHPLCAAIAEHAPRLEHLDISFRYLLDIPESAQVPDMLLTAGHPLLSLRHLSTVSLWIDHGMITLSDVVLESFAEAWPRLVDFRICIRTLPLNETGAPRLYPTSVTLRSLRAFSRHCSSLQHLHIPHLYVTLEDCFDFDGREDSEASPSHALSRLAVCRAIVYDVEVCALALHRIFPHLDLDAPRDMFSLSHSAKNMTPGNAAEDRPFAVAWLGVMNALAECQTSMQDTDPSCC